MTSILNGCANLPSYYIKTEENNDSSAEHFKFDIEGAFSWKCVIYIKINAYAHLSKYSRNENCLRRCWRRRPRRWRIFIHFDAKIFWPQKPHRKITDRNVMNFQLSKWMINSQNGSNFNGWIVHQLLPCGFRPDEKKEDCLRCGASEIMKMRSTFTKSANTLTVQFDVIRYW